MHNSISMGTNMAINEITKPQTKQELAKAINQQGWQFLEAREAVNANDVRDITTRTSNLVRSGKKLCIVVIERP